MTKRKEVPAAPPEGETTVTNESAETEAKPVEKPLDPKEIARQRSKDDIARKRRNLYHKGGRR